MTENRSNWREAFQNAASQGNTTRQGNNTLSEKPRLNEILKTELTPDPAATLSAMAEIAEEKVTAETATASVHPGLAEGMRLFGIKQWENSRRELLLVQADVLSDDERTDLAYYLGLCCAKLERFDDAILYLEQVIGSGGNPLRVYQCRMTLAYIFILTDHAEKAETELEHLQSNGLESVMLYNTWAYAAYAQKRYIAAMDMYEKALDIDKDNATALNSLGYILVDMGVDKLKGLRLCRKAVDKNPQNAAYLDSLGWANYKCGKLAEARTLLRQAIDLAPHEQEIRKHFKVVSGVGGGIR